MLGFTIWTSCELVTLKITHYSAFEHHLKGPPVLVGSCVFSLTKAPVLTYMLLTSSPTDVIKYSTFAQSPWVDIT